MPDPEVIAPVPVIFPAIVAEELFVPRLAVPPVMLQFSAIERVPADIVFVPAPVKERFL